jgi:hypothetical protein
MVLKKQMDNFYTKAKHMTRNHSTKLNGQYRAAIFNLDIPLRFVAAVSVVTIKFISLKLYNDQSNAQVNLFINLLLPYMFRVFF